MIDEIQQVPPCRIIMAAGVIQPENTFITERTPLPVSRQLHHTPREQSQYVPHGGSIHGRVSHGSTKPKGVRPLSRVSLIEAQKCFELQKLGNTYEQIGEAMGFSGSTARNRLYEFRRANPQHGSTVCPVCNQAKHTNSRTCRQCARAPKCGS